MKWSGTGNKKTGSLFFDKNLNGRLYLQLLVEVITLVFKNDTFNYDPTFKQEHFYVPVRVY